jgi:hypothetical protein
MESGEIVAAATVVVAPRAGEVATTDAPVTVEMAIVTVAATSQARMPSATITGIGTDIIEVHAVVA